MYDGMIEVKRKGGGRPQNRDNGPYPGQLPPSGVHSPFLSTAAAQVHD
jgi:hypothetical protein